jgi:hypothetical protein
MIDSSMKKLAALTLLAALIPPAALAQSELPTQRIELYGSSFEIVDVQWAKEFYIRAKPTDPNPRRVLYEQVSSAIITQHGIVAGHPVVIARFAPLPGGKMESPESIFWKDSKGYWQRTNPSLTWPKLCLGLQMELTTAAVKLNPPSDQPEKQGCTWVPGGNFAPNRS